MGEPLTVDRRTEVWIRDRGKCRRCGSADGCDVHHRIPRGMGGTNWKHQHNLKILILLCRSCHEWIEINRAKAYEQGWLLPGYLWREAIERGETPPDPVPVTKERPIPKGTTANSAIITTTTATTTARPR